MKVPFILCAASVVLLSACGSMKSMAPMMSQADVPEAVKVPVGNKVAMETVGVGEITYECRESSTVAGQVSWVFVGPDAVLNDRAGKAVGKYFGPPATWAANDGSKITGTQVSTAPGGNGNIPFQLVRANPAMGQGAMMGVTYVQRLATQGGVAPATGCTMDARGKREIVKYQADYLFWAAR
jgi:hypothetical protein